jgi:cullin 4
LSIYFVTEYDPEFDMGESMFKDIALSRDLVSGYRDYKLKRKNKGKGREQMEEDEDLDSGPKFTVMVLQQSVWPFSARKHNVDLPPYVCGPLLSVDVTIRLYW